MDIYISYRRNSFPIARLICEKLKSRGFSVFIDLDSMDSLPVADQIFHAIEFCKYFLLILEPHSLDRCKVEHDFIRKEIEHALMHGRIIIPLVTPGFEFPDDLPSAIRLIRDLMWVSLSMDYFDASFEKLICYLQDDAASTIPDSQSHADRISPVKLASNDKSFIFISYAHRNHDEVLPVIRELQWRGFRVWYDEGIDPGTEWDEYIAERIESCGMLFAMISKEYLESENCKDELNFARDLNKKRILIYLGDVSLPRGMAMRLNRLQAIHKYTYPDMESFMEKVLSIQNIYDFCDTGS